MGRGQRVAVVLVVSVAHTVLSCQGPTIGMSGGGFGLGVFALGVGGTHQARGSAVLCCW